MGNISTYTNNDIIDVILGFLLTRKFKEVKLPPYGSIKEYNVIYNNTNNTISVKYDDTDIKTDLMLPSEMLPNKIICSSSLNAFARITYDKDSVIRMFDYFIFNNILNTILNVCVTKDIYNRIRTSVIWKSLYDYILSRTLGKMCPEKLLLDHFTICCDKNKKSYMKFLPIYKA